MRILSLSIAAFVLLLMTVPALAHHRTGHDGGPGGVSGQCTGDNTAGDNGACEKQVGSAQHDGDCDSEDEQNHGQFVSCVAHSAHGGDGDIEAQDFGLDDCDGNIVSCAARSDAGKEDQGAAAQGDNSGDNSD